MMKMRIPTFLLICCVLAWSPRATAQTPISIIQISDYDACVSPDDPVEVQLSAEGAGITDWWWDFGNGTQSSLPRPVAEYDAPQNYDVTLTVDTGLHGPMTLVEENLIQINQLVLEDDFGNPYQSLDNWEDFDPSMIVDSVLELEVKVKPPREDQQNGDIICLNGGGRNPPVSNGRFFFDLELIAEDPRIVEYSALRLLDDNSQAPKILADLRVRRVTKNFEIRIETLGVIGSWHPLVQLTPVLTVGLDWYQAGGIGGLTLEIQEDSEPAVIQHLDLGPQADLAHVQLGVIDLEWPDDGTSAGKIRVDNFRTCRFEHRPDPE